MKRSGTKVRPTITPGKDGPLVVTGLTSLLNSRGKHGDGSRRPSSSVARTVMGCTAIHSSTSESTG
jgi:hypothetical protein